MAESRKRGMSIRKKLMLTVIFLIAISLLLGVAGFLGIAQLGGHIRSITGSEVNKLALAETLAQESQAARVYEKEFFLFSTLNHKDKMEEYNNKHVQATNTVGILLANLKELGKDDPEFTPKVEAMETRLLDTQRSWRELAKPLFQGGDAYLKNQDLYQAYKGNITGLLADLADTKKYLLQYVGKTRAEAVFLQENLTKILPVASVVVLVLAIFIGMTVSTRISGSLTALMKGIEAVGRGDTVTDLKVPTNDEFADIADVFNDTMNRLQQYIQTDEERKQTQENVIRFLDVVSEASDGNLTVKAPVTADVFGNIADAYNLMVDSLADLMKDIRRSAEQVGRESRHMLDIFKDIEQGAENQMTRVKEATESVDETSATTLDISEKSNIAQEMAARADAATAKGNELVLQNIEGMQLIRVTVQSINKKMKSLGERLMEINTISQLISEVASRTTILAMNASIEAARAGEQGRGFIVIADEIKSLADKSAEATKQITGIIKAIQTEAGEVTASLEEETNTVEEQTRLAQNTGEAFKQIESSISDSRNSVGDIFTLSQKQRELTRKVVISMEEVGRISMQALAQVKDASTITDGLTGTSETLLSSISRFRLASDDGSPAESGETYVASAAESRKGNV